MLLRELRLAVRTLLKTPGFTASAVLILMLGCGATTAIFSVTYGVLLRDLPYKQPDRLVTIAESLLPSGERISVSAADYYFWRERQRVFADLGLARSVTNYNLTGAGEPERLLGGRASAGLFSTLGVEPMLGRVFTEEEQLDPERASRVAILSYGLWQRRFGGDPAVVGRDIDLNSTRVTVVGVMPESFRYPSRDFELWTPLYIPPETLAQRSSYSFRVVARLRDGITIDQARAEMQSLAADLAREHPNDQPTGIVVEPMLGDLTAQFRPALWVLLAAVGLLFLIGCVNLALLLLARAAARRKEFAIRAALGATRGNLARQFFIESIPVALLGGALGVLAAAWILELLVPMLPATMPRLDEIGLHTPVMLFAVVLAMTAAVLISMAPAALVSARVDRGPSKSARMRDFLLVAEIAGTVVLLVSAGLLMRSFAALRTTDPGFIADRVLGLHFAVNRAAHGGDDRSLAQYLGRLIQEVRQVPGVEAVGIVNRLPLGGQTQTFNLLVEGRAAQVYVDSRPVNGDYFKTLGIPLRAGRTFDDRDTPDSLAVGIVDERFAAEMFPGHNPIGKRFRIPLQIPGNNFSWVQIVGVAGHVHHEGLDRDPRPQVYWPYTQFTQDRVAMVVKTRTDPSSMAGAVRAAIQSVDPQQPIYDVRPMTETLKRTLTGYELNTLLVGSFAALGLLLASVGLYGVVSQLTARRSREFGIRMALGATSRSVLGLVLRQGLVRAFLGLALGLTGSMAVTRVLAGMLHGVTPLDTLSYVYAAAVLIAVVTAAAYLPARRAAAADPAQALRAE